MKDFAGYFLQPTIIKGMNKQMITTREETFAPVVGNFLLVPNTCNRLARHVLI